jgi:hypothetical protein
MALTKTVTNVSVIVIDRKWRTITHRLVIGDDAGDGFDKTYSLQFMHGTAMPVKTAEFKVLMQMDIDNYKTAETLRKSTALTSSVTNIEDGLVVT